MFNVFREQCAPSFRARGEFQMVPVESWCIRGVMLWAGIREISIGGVVGPEQSPDIHIAFMLVVGSIETISSSHSVCVSGRISEGKGLLGVS